jgi:hypothetical protein
MKKSASVVLSTVMFSAILSCSEKKKEDKWIVGSQKDGTTRDTVVNNRPYRYYGAFWFPIYNGLISPSTYNGASAAEIGRPGYTPTRSVRSGGFGSSSRTVSA